MGGAQGDVPDAATMPYKHLTDSTQVVDHSLCQSARQLCNGNSVPQLEAVRFYTCYQVGCHTASTVGIKCSQPQLGIHGASGLSVCLVSHLSMPVTPNSSMNTRPSQPPAWQTDGSSSGTATLLVVGHRG
jgi:hypothetical protein